MVIIEQRFFKPHLGVWNMQVLNFLSQEILG